MMENSTQEAPASIKVLAHYLGLSAVAATNVTADAAFKRIKELEEQLNSQPIQPVPRGVVDLAQYLGVKKIATNIVTEVALMRIKELENDNIVSAEIIGTLNTSVMHVHNREHPRNKYDREILPKVHVDVYDVLNAFEVWKPEVAHAVKKLLAAGKRGDKSLLQDLQEAQASIEAAVRREEQKN